MVIALNQVDLMEKKGLSVDVEKLAKTLGIPVATTVAIKGKGIKELTELIIEASAARTLPASPSGMASEIEERIEKLSQAVMAGSEYRLPRQVDGYQAPGEGRGDHKAHRGVKSTANTPLLAAVPGRRDRENSRRAVGHRDHRRALSRSRYDST